MRRVRSRLGQWCASGFFAIRKRKKSISIPNNNYRYIVRRRVRNVRCHRTMRVRGEKQVSIHWPGGGDERAKTAEPVCVFAFYRLSRGAALPKPPGGNRLKTRHRTALTDIR